MSRDLERPGEPIGFAAWLGFHSQLTATEVPAAGTDRRQDLADRFARCLAAGYTPEEFRAASERQASLVSPEGAFAFLPARS